MARGQKSQSTNPPNQSKAFYWQEFHPTVTSFPCLVFSVVFLTGPAHKSSKHRTGPIKEQLMTKVWSGVLGLVTPRVQKFSTVQGAGCFPNIPRKINFLVYFLDKMLPLCTAII